VWTYKGELPFQVERHGRRRIVEEDRRTGLLGCRGGIRLREDTDWKATEQIGQRSRRGRRSLNFAQVLCGESTDDDFSGNRGRSLRREKDFEMDYFFFWGGGEGNWDFGRSTNGRAMDGVVCIDGCGTCAAHHERGQTKAPAAAARGQDIVSQSYTIQTA
jgi:hypothetical protein